MIYQLKAYLSFIFKSTNQHGIHSPFVYDLCTKCFYNHQLINTIQRQKLKQYRSSLLNNLNTIEVSDFGSGSKVFKSNKRKVSDIAKHAGISLKRGELLFKLVKYFKPKQILEIGTSLGMATHSLSLDNTSSIITLEGCLNTLNTAKNHIEYQNITNVNFINGKFEDTLPEVLKHHNFDLIFFDGNHTKEATIRYFNWCKNYAHNESLFIFDDIHWSNEMSESWQEIINDDAVKVSIDTFQWGLVFFRNEQPKQHFTIRV